jgi:hypothetical protein
MKRIPRDPEKFEVIDLFDAIGKKHNFKLHDKDSERDFLESIKTSLGRHKSPIILHGRRVEAMFGYVAASLGRSTVVKREDSGEVFLESTDVKVPDYRVVTKEGDQFLVEVKNCHKSDPFSKYSIKSTYLEGLKSYARLLNIDLKLAIYWSRWNKWVLISPSDLECDDSACVTSFIDSYKQNKMTILGDITIGTTPPLVFQLLTDPRKPRHINANGKVGFTIGRIELVCAGKRITEEKEQNIAFYLMLFGDWPTNEPKALIENRELLGIEYMAEPIERTSGQGFEIVGAISGMISRHYNELTAPSGQIERLAPKVEPGMLGISIPDDYKGQQLPLWRFTQQPTNLMKKIADKAND